MISYSPIAFISSHISWRQSLDHARPFAEPRLEYAVRILEHSIFQAHDDELRALELRLDETSNVLRVRQVESGVDLVQDVHRCRLELEQGHDE